MKYQSRNVDKLIRENYSESYLNNTKWFKLIESLTEKMDKVFIKYKLVYDDVIEDFIFSYSDAYPYFIEPILYKEVEWIEFPVHFESWVNENNLKAEKKTYNQDVIEIEKELNRIGKFKIEKFENCIRLYAYK